MNSVLSKGKYNLVCVAHPDDETLFFGGLLLSRKRRRLPWVVICTTSDRSRKRKQQFHRACKALGVSLPLWWGFPDIYDQRLDLDHLIEKLRELPAPHEVFTHGAVGEYGHPHHQDVGLAVHRAFAGHPRVFAPAYNTFPDFTVELTAREFSLKAKILTEIYGSETSRFLNVLPVTFVEGFCRLKLGEIQALHDFFAQKKRLRTTEIKKNQSVIKYLPHLRDLKRPF